MTRLLTAVFLFASFNAVADELKTFSDGQVINADDFNHNFQKLEQDIADIPEGPQGPMGNPGNPGPQGEQGPAGPAGADGADGVAAGLSCATDQIIRWSGSAWVCVTEPITAYWVTKNYKYESETQIDYNLKPVTCYDRPAPIAGVGDCIFEVLGVADHTRCATQVSDQYFRATVTTYPSAVEVRELRELEEIHVTITCLP